MNIYTKCIFFALLLVLTNTLHAAVPSDGHYSGSAQLTFTITDLQLTSKSSENVKAVIRSGSFGNGSYDREIIVLGPQDRKFFEYFTNSGAQNDTYLAHIYFNSISGAAAIDFISAQLTSTIHGTSRSLRLTFTSPNVGAIVNGDFLSAAITLTVTLAK